jgi:hypothetical protein
MNDRNHTSFVRRLEREDVAQAGRRYQALFRILDLVSLHADASVWDQVSALTDEEFNRVFEAHYPDAPQSERRKLVSDFLLEDPEALSTTNVFRALMASKRRGLKEFMAQVHLFSVDNRRRRMDADKASKEPITRDHAMTVVRLPEGHGSGKIVRAAVLYKGFVWSKPSPMRHSDIINEMYDILGGNIDSMQTDGFVSASGHFLGRRSALVLARDCGQEFIEEPAGDELFSENIW